MYNNNQYMIDNLNRQKDRIDDMIRSYQQPQPVNNFINTNQPINDNLYELKVLNDGDESENILVNRNTIFLGINRLQIKKIDGSIEKYNIDKVYPIDPKDEKIKELNKKLEELERRLNNEHAESIKPIKDVNESNVDDDGNVNRKSKTDSKSISK